MLNTQSAPTRERVLSIVKRQGSVTVKELTEELEITPMAIRGHLNKLEKDQLIKVENIKQKLGRPLQVFSLTEKGDACFPKDYSRFSVDLLENIRDLDDGETLDKLIDRREEKSVEERRRYIGNISNPKEKLERYCQYLDELGYMPKLQQISDTVFILHENNCALKEIASSFEFCCSSEISILRAVFTDAKITRLANQINNDSKCSYQFDFR